MTAPTPGPDAVARDEVGEVGPTLRTADDLRQYEREGVRLDGSMGFAWWVDGDWITATDQYFSSEALIEDYGFVFVSFDPHLTPQPDGPSDSFREKLERSSLGTPEAKAARESVPLEVAQEIVRRSNEDRAARAPQPDGDVRERGTKGPTEHLIDTIGRVMLDEWERAEGEPLNVSYITTLADGIRAVLASGLVVPVGEAVCSCGDTYREKFLRVGQANMDLLNELAQAVAQVAAVRRELERWDGYGHGEFNIHMPENLPCSACNLMAAIRAEIRAALDTAPASPTTTGADS